jgi:DNA transformation protein
MAKTHAFCDHLVDVLQPALGPVSYRAMFGAHALYAQGLIFACYDDGLLMLKADDGNRGAYTSRGIQAWLPSPNMKTPMPYYAVPDDVLADEDQLRAWAQDALAAAQRIVAARKPKAVKKAKG